MAYQNFKPMIWSKYIQHELEKKCKLVDDCWRRFEGEARQGESVKILGVGRVTVGTYTGADIGAPENVADSSVILPIDQAKFFNFQVDDVDKAQSVPGLMEALMEEATRAMAQVRDGFVASLAAGEGLTASASTAITTAANAKKAIDDGIQALRENDVDVTDDVVIEIAPFLYRLLRDQLVELKTDNDQLIKKGHRGDVRQLPGEALQQPLFRRHRHLHDDPHEEGHRLRLRYRQGGGLPPPEPVFRRRQGPEPLRRQGDPPQGTLCPEGPQVRKE